MIRPFLFKAPSPIHGTGVFTRRNIGKYRRFYDVPSTDVSHAPAHGCAYIGRGTWVSDEQVLNYVNHSCNPNAMIVLGSMPSLHSLRRISRGEEITVDYTRTETGGSRVKCNCQSPNCRGYFLRKE